MTAIITTAVEVKNVRPKEYSSQVCEHKYFRELQKLNFMCFCTLNVLVHNAAQAHFFAIASKGYIN